MGLIPNSILWGSEDVNTTALRPSAPDDGHAFYDTTLGMAIWWDDSNSVWVDAQGRDITDGTLSIANDGTPVDGTSGTGAGVVGPGCLCIDTSNTILYINTGTRASPLWLWVGTVYSY